MLAGVMAMYGGECKSLDISTLKNPLDIRYIVVGNSSNISGMDIISNNTHVNICFKPNYKPDNFTLVFFNEVTGEISNTVYQGGGGGGGSSTKYIKENITVYEPKYIDKIINNTEVVEVEKIVEEIVYQDTGYDLWMVFLAMVTGAVMFWFIIRGKGDGGIE